jgi:uncharacterized protein YndB with AHSA1/START domain
MIDGTLATVDGRPTLRFERALTHSIERVWRAISEPAELERWFPAVVAWTPAAGETIEAYGMTGEVTEVDVPHRLAWTFAGDLYSFDLTEQEGGCRLVFTHTFDEGTPTAQTAAGWQTYLLRLDAHLAGDFLDEEAAHQSWGEIHERYAERFGVDPEPGRNFWAQMQAAR